MILETSILELVKKNELLKENISTIIQENMGQVRRGQGVVEEGMGVCGGRVAH